MKWGQLNMKNKEIYSSPELWIITMQAKDVIRTSSVFIPNAPDVYEKDPFADAETFIEK